MKKVIIAGASGLIGSYLLRFLLEENSIGEVTALVRKPLDISHKNLVQRQISFDKPESFKEFITGDVLFCCLGSTRKKTPDQRDYRKVDYDYPLALAQLASQNQVQQFHIVSALGANPHSVNFYSRLKGEVERDIKVLNFRSIHIYKPSLLEGPRQEKRPLEKVAMKLMKIINPLLRGNLTKYRSIKAEIVALAMYKQSLKNSEGVFIYPSDKIIESV